MRITVFYCLLLCFAFPHVTELRAQTREADSLRNILAANPDTSQFKAYKDMCWVFLDLGQYDSAEVWADRFYNSGEELSSNQFKAEGRYMKGIALARRGGHDPEAVEAQTQAMDYYELSGNLSGQGFANLMIGFVYYNQKNYSGARVYWLKSRELFIKASNDLGLANVYTNLGALEKQDGNLSAAQNLFLQALSIFRANRKPIGVANNLSELSDLKMMQYDLVSDSTRKAELSDSALAFQREALELYRKIGNAHGVVTLWTGLARYYAHVGNQEMAKTYADSSFSHVLTADSKSDLRDVYAVYSQIYELRGDYRNALEYHRKWATLDDSLRGAETAEKTTTTIAAYEAEQKQKQVEYDKKIARLIMIGVAIGLALTIAIVFITYRAYKKSKSFVALLAERNSVISQKNADITDSIQYSKRIQQALLPDEKQVKSVLGEAFVFYKPKDIISGDFYWMQERGGKIFFMAADCTGHGVPGALMSMIGTTLLNESVLERNLSDPGMILDDVRSGIIRSLRQEDDDQSTKDGMDGALCVYDRATSMLLYAGAYNPVWIFRKKQLIELDADKFPVGISGSELRQFTTKSISLETGDIVYAFTDGYVDQFGGPKGKKLKYSGMRELLIKVSDLPVTEQHKRIEEFFLEWRGVHEQLDDVCVIGLRIN